MDVAALPGWHQRHILTRPPPLHFFALPREVCRGDYSLPGARRRMKGWIPLWRKFFGRNDWLSPSKRSPACAGYAWLDLCQLAQYEDYAGERLERG